MPNQNPIPWEERPAAPPALFPGEAHAPRFDAHCHLSPEWQADKQSSRDDSTSVPARILCSAHPADWQDLIAATAAWPGTVPALGLHPWRIRETDADWADRLAALLSANQAAWVGEIGLDAAAAGKDGSAQQQAKCFTVQLRLARTLHKPLNLHCVRAWEQIVTALDRNYLTDGPRPFVLHSFAGPGRLVRPLTERGAWFSVGGRARRPDTAAERERTAALPIERLLLESDAFLVSPGDSETGLAGTAAGLAAALEMPQSDLTRQLAENAARLGNILK